MLFQSAIQKFLTYLEAKGTSPTTRKIYRQRLNWFFSYQKVQTLGDICPDMVDNWLVHLRRAGLSGETIRSRVRDVKIFYNWCIRRGYVPCSPVEHITLKRPRQNRVKAITKEELNQLLNHAQTKRDRAMILFMAETGCRAGEVATLQKENLQLAYNCAHVVGKTGGRWVDFGEQTKTALTDLLNGDTTPGPVFCTRLHTAVKPATIYQAFRRIARACGVKRFNPHSIRHYVGMVYTEQGNLELARQKLGHSDITTTAIYANQDRAKVKAFTDKVNILG